jgi:hypothetical protein
MRTPSIPDQLRGGDRRSLGRANAIVRDVMGNPRLFPQLLRGMWSDDPAVAMRAADAVEKITLQKPALLAPYKAELLGLMSEAEQIELRWHLCLMAPRLPLTPSERQRVIKRLRVWLEEDRSAIVRTFALQALADLSAQDADLREETVELLHAAARTGTAAMKARARKLLKQMRAQ